MKKKYIFLLLTIILLFLMIALNPETKDYKAFSEEIYGKSPSESFEIEIERKNYLLFSTYSPVVAYEHGITHLGILGFFIKISDGQFN